MILRRIADETLLVPIRGQLANLQHIFAIDPVAALVWDRLDGRHSFAALVADICAEFAVERAQAGQDCREFLQELLAAQLVKAATP